jgi:hypothetical protein
VPYQRTKTTDFGASFGGLATVGYQLKNADGSNNGSRVTSGVAELVAGTGIYRATVTFPSAFRGYVVWDTGGGSPVYDAEPINPETEEFAGAEPGSKRAEADVIYGGTSGDLVYLRRRADGSDSPAEAGDVATVAVAADVLTVTLTAALPASFAVGALATATITGAHADLSFSELPIRSASGSSFAVAFTHADLPAAAAAGVATTALALIRVPASERDDADVAARVAAAVLVDPTHPIATDLLGRVLASAVAGDVGGRILGGGGAAFVDVGVQADLQSWDGVAVTTGVPAAATAQVVASRVAGDVGGRVLGGGSTAFAGVGVQADLQSWDGVAVTTGVPAAAGTPVVASNVTGDVQGRVRGGGSSTFLGTGTQGKLAPDGLDNVVVEAGVNARQALSPILAAAAGVLSGAGTGGPIVIKNPAGSVTRITAVTDSAGNRSSITPNYPA